VDGIVLQDFAVKHTLNLEPLRTFYTKCEVILFRYNQALLPR